METFYNSNQFPKDNGEGYSNDVLIDMDGRRKNFRVGWYDFDEREWRFHVSDISDLVIEKMQWTYLPT